MVVLEELLLLKENRGGGLGLDFPEVNQDAESEIRWVLDGVQLAADEAGFDTTEGGETEMLGGDWDVAKLVMDDVVVKIQEDLDTEVLVLAQAFRAALRPFAATPEKMVLVLDGLFELRDIGFPCFW